MRMEVLHGVKLNNYLTLMHIFNQILVTSLHGYRYFNS
jgi:hypothetical protein